MCIFLLECTEPLKILDKHILIFSIDYYFNLSKYYYFQKSTLLISQTTKIVPFSISQMDTIFKRILFSIYQTTTILERVLFSLYHKTTLLKRVLFSIFQTTNLIKIILFSISRTTTLFKRVLFSNWLKITPLKRVLLKRVLFLQKIVLLKRVPPNPTHMPKVQWFILRPCIIYTRPTWRNKSGV